MLKYSPLTHQHQTRHHRSVENPSLWLKLLINFILQLNCSHQPILQSTLWCMFYRSNNMKGFFILYIITLILQTTFQYHLGLVAASWNLHAGSRHFLSLKNMYNAQKLFNQYTSCHPSLSVGVELLYPTTNHRFVATFDTNPNVVV